MIITNPPIHAGKTKVYEIIRGASNYLNEKGELWIVIRKDQGAKSLIKDMSDIYNFEIVKRDNGFYILKAKKQVEYKGDERWLTIQLKANQSANIANWTLIILLAIATSVPLFIDIQIMFTLDRVILFGELFIGLRNLLELIAIMYFDKQL